MECTFYLSGPGLMSPASNCSSILHHIPRMPNVPLLRPLTLTGFTLLVFFQTLVAQNPQIHTKTGSRFPTVIFTSVLWAADPSYYSIAIDATGTATYQSAPDSIGKTGVPYTLEFQVSDRTRRVTFNVARQLDYFGDKAQQSVSSPQASSVRTLTYHDSTIRHQITYGSSSDSEIDELTSVFEEISATLEFGRRLAYFHQHESGRLNGELDRLQASAQRRTARELQVIAPVLRSIASDDRLETGVRKKAEALLVAPTRP